MILSYRYRLYPTKAQSVALGEMLGDFCELYRSVRRSAKPAGCRIACFGSRLRKLTVCSQSKGPACQSR